MNTRENQRKFAQKSNIKNSEFDRQNTNATRYTNPISNGKNLLPPDIENRKNVQTKDFILIITSTILGIFFFFFVVPLSQFFISYAHYSSLEFLFISLLLSVFLVLILIFTGRRILKIK